MASRLKQHCFLVVMACLCTFAIGVQAADSRSSRRAHPHPSVQQLQEDPAQVVTQVMHNELSADLDDHSLWMYVCDKVDHAKEVTRKVVETPKGDLTLTTAQGGHPLSPEELKKQDAQLEELAHDPGALAKWQQGQHEDDQRARELMKMLPTAF